jgi:hypothetical protein
VRDWNITFTNNAMLGGPTAYDVQITGATIMPKTGLCMPSVASNTFPLAVGEVDPMKTSTGVDLFIDFTGCGSNHINPFFTVNIPYSSNAGTCTGFLKLTNSTQ